MTDLEKLKTLLEREYKLAKTRQTEQNQKRNHPSGFMNGIQCAIDHIDGLVSSDTSEKLHDNHRDAFAPALSMYCQKDVEMTEEMFNMLEVVRPRGGGKTMRLMFESYKTGAIIVCPTQKMCEYVRKMATDLGIEIPTPITFDKFLYQRGDKVGQKFLIDELILCLQGLTQNEIVGYSHSSLPHPDKGYVIYVNDRQVNEKIYTSFEAAAKVAKSMYYVDIKGVDLRYTIKLPAYLGGGHSCVHIKSFNMVY